MPRVQMHVTSAVELFKKLDGSRMLSLLADSDVPRRLFDVKGLVDITAGVFGVPKSADEDRLITDRRLANALERPVGAVRDLFPHASPSFPSPYF